MSQEILNELIQKTDRLTPEETLTLLSHLSSKLQQNGLVKTPHRSWRELRGIAKEPLMGEDAQSWVSRTRQEDTVHREQGIRGEV